MSYHNDMAELEQELAKEQTQEKAEAMAFRSIRSVVKAYLAQPDEGKNPFYKMHMELMAELMQVGVTEAGGEW